MSVHEDLKNTWASTSFIKVPQNKKSMALTLYQFPTCPYCAKARAALEKYGLEFETIDVATDREDPLRKELLEKSQVATVPVLKTGELYIGDSSNIITWAEENSKKV